MIESNAIFPPIQAQAIFSKANTMGLLIACCIMSVWAINLGVLLQLEIDRLVVWLIPLAILWQMFLYTGLFITAHDAMHGSVCPQNLKLNHFIGALAVLCYGAFSYQKVLKNHWLHHHYPTSSRDPDFHNGEHQNPFLWYLRFMRKYWGWQQFLALSAAFQIAHYLLGISQLNLALFWVIPPILSSVQLFYFGTFLTHREPEAGYSNSHCAETIPLPIFWSFVTCYHFGYHQEHHEYPQASWWQLPSVYNFTIHSKAIHSRVIRNRVPIGEQPESDPLLTSGRKSLQSFHLRAEP